MDATQRIQAAIAAIKHPPLASWIEAMFAADGSVRTDDQDLIDIRSASFSPYTTLADGSQAMLIGGIYNNGVHYDTMAQRVFRIREDVVLYILETRDGANARWVIAVAVQTIQGPDDIIKQVPFYSRKAIEEICDTGIDFFRKQFG